jgi:hypothetical protein
MEYTGKLTGAQLYIESLGECGALRNSVSCTGKEKDERSCNFRGWVFPFKTRGSRSNYRSVFNDDPFFLRIGAGCWRTMVVTMSCDNPIYSLENV